MKTTDPICEVKANGNKLWYLNDEYHREEYANGTKTWYLNVEYITDDPFIFLIKLHKYQLTSSLIPV